MASKRSHPIINSTRNPQGQLTQHKLAASVFLPSTANGGSAFEGSLRRAQRGARQHRQAGCKPGREREPGPKVRLRREKHATAIVIVARKVCRGCNKVKAIIKLEEKLNQFHVASTVYVLYGRMIAMALSSRKI